MTLDKVKKALRIVTDDFDDELTDLISAGLADMGIAGVNGVDAVEDDVLITKALITYCKVNFGEPDEYDRLKKSYDEQKAQLSMHTGYTEWSE